MLDFKAKASVVVAAFEGGTLMDDKEFDSFQGVFEWVTRFMADPTDLCRAGYQCRRAFRSKKKRGRKARGPAPLGVKPSQELVDAIGTTLRAVEARDFKPLVADPC
jgi:hypothetical protein